MSEQELRFKCLEFVINRGVYSDPLYQILEAQTLYHYISVGQLPVYGTPDANVEVGRLIRNAIEQLKNECNDSNKPDDCGDEYSDELPFRKPFVKRFLSKLGLKKPVF